MFVYDITGGTKKERKTVEDALHFAKQYLMPRIRILDIEISLKKNMDVDADVVGDDREFTMRIRKGQERDDLLTSVFHEMVHVKQYVRNEFPVFEVGCEVDYLERPWEIEAFDLQEKMLDTYNTL